MLKPYSGSRVREHLGGDGRPHVLATYGSDTSGRKSYAFNSLGFRGEEPDPRARATVFVSGCSHAFGTGLDAEEAWPHRFKRLWAARLGCDAGDVNLLNFAQGGASCDYVARSLLAQCEDAVPDLLVAQFPASHRAEAFVDGEPYCIGLDLWPGVRTWTRFLAVPWREKARVWSRLRQAAGHARVHTEESGLANALRNMLLLQSFCAARGIRCAMSFVEHPRLRDPDVAGNAALGPLVRLLDPRVLCDFGMRDSQIRIDPAADGGHAGPRSHAAFAERLAAFLDRSACVA